MNSEELANRTLQDINKRRAKAEEEFYENLKERNFRKKRGINADI